MATYIELVNWTDQGVRAVKDTIKRAKAFAEAQSMGITVSKFHWTLGPMTSSFPSTRRMTKLSGDGAHARAAGQRADDDAAGVWGGGDGADFRGIGVR